MTPTRHWTKVILTSILLWGGILPGAADQESTPLALEDVLGARAFEESSPFQFSPDGKKVVYTLRANQRRDSKKPESVPGDAIGEDVYLLDTGTESSIKVTEGSGKNWLPAWSPDGRYLAFLSDRDERRQAKLWIWEAATRRTRKVSDVSVRTSRIQWLPTSEEVLVTVLPESKSSDEFALRVSGSQELDANTVGSTASTVVIYRSAPLSQASSTKPDSAPWNLDASLCDLAVVDVRDGHVRRIDTGHRISAFFLSPDGSEVAYTSAQSFERPGSQQILFNVVLLPLGGEKLRVVASDVPLDYAGGALSWSPDASFLAFRTGGMDAKGDCYVVDPKFGTTKNVTSFKARHSGFAFLPPSWDGEGKYLFFTDGTTLWKTSPGRTEAEQIVHTPNRRIIRLIENRAGGLWLPEHVNSIIALTFDEESKQFEFFGIGQANNQTTALLKIHQCRMCGAFNLPEFAAVSTDRRQLLYISQDAEHDSDLWLTNSEFVRPRRLTHINPQYDQHRMGAARLIEWRGLDGDLLRGTILLPAAYTQGKRYPLIVWVYGGERGSDYSDRFGLAGGGPFNLQIFATRGYAVLYPDAPQHLGTPMLDLAKTVLPGVDKVIEMGIADPDRLGVIGHSNGGYSVLSLIVQTKRFKAAIECSGPGDLLGMYGEMDSSGSAFGTGWAEVVGQMGGTPWEFRERYVDNSPIFFLDRVETPLLIVHGGKDTTVAPFLGDQIFVALRRLGKEVEYAKYDGEGHSPLSWSYPNQVDFSNRMIVWFDDHLKKSGDQAAEKPK